MAYERYGLRGIPYCSADFGKSRVLIQNDIEFSKSYFWRQVRAGTIKISLYLKINTISTNSDSMTLARVN
jgi:hypothetical protein